MKRALLAGVVLGLAVVAMPSAASADTVSVNFEPPTYSVGNINGQDGWSKTGSYDAAVDSSFGVPSFGTQSLRISNAVTSGSFGDQTFSKSLADEAGEAGALNGGMSGGARQKHFEASFEIRPMQLSEQPGLFLSVSPDRGDGARMSYLGFADTPAGIDVTFYDVQGTSNPANFVPTLVADNLSRAVTHTAKFEIDFLAGPSNDIVKIYIDGVLVHTGTTWENYYRFDDESNPTLENISRTVDSLLFRTGGASAPATAGEGFLIDNVQLSSSQPLVQTKRVFLTSGSSFTVPADWSNASNTIEVIGGGGGAGDDDQISYGGYGGGGGGGGGYAKVSNVSLTPGANLQYYIGQGGQGGTGMGNGTAGTATLLCPTNAACNSTGALVAASGGGLGTWGSNVGGVGGQGGTPIVGSGFNGGKGGNGGASGGAGAGGGAAGPFGTGGVGAIGGNGGSGGNGFGGAGGLYTSCGTVGNTGGAGAEFDATHGSGGGGSSGNGASGGNGGGYGSGGGGAGVQGAGCATFSKGGNGAPGVIVITYTSGL